MFPGTGDSCTQFLWFPTGRIIFIIYKNFYLCLFRARHELAQISWVLWNVSWVLHFEITIKTLCNKNYHVFLKWASIQRFLLSQSERAGGWFYQQHAGWHYTTHLLEYKLSVYWRCALARSFRPISDRIPGIYIATADQWGHINVHKYFVIAKFLGAKPISGLLECYCMEQDHSQAPIDSTSHLSKGEGLHFRDQTGKT